MAIIVGIDPGSRVTGFGVISTAERLNSENGQLFRHINHGIIQLDAGESVVQRIFELGESLEVVFAKYKPDIVVVEKIFLGKNADSAFKLGHARGVVIYEAMRAKAQVVEYATRLVKQGITGKGSADKEAVQSVVARLLNLKAISKLDASDALSLAVFHAFQLQKHQGLVKAMEI